MGALREQKLSVGCSKGAKLSIGCSKGAKTSNGCSKGAKTSNGCSKGAMCRFRVLFYQLSTDGLLALCCKAASQTLYWGVLCTILYTMYYSCLVCFVCKLVSQ